MDISTKIVFFIFCMSGLNLLNHTWRIFLELRKDDPQKLKLSKIDKFFLGASVSFILTTILTSII